MALIDLKSNLKKSNVYKDTPGGGNSGLPYIKQGLPEDSPAGEYLAGIARSSLDIDIRGGAYSTIASTEDTVRISRFLNDYSRGIVFTAKQIGLQKSNPLVETERRGDVINTQVYNLNANLLAQVALQGTGVHVPRAGFNANDLLQDQNKYEKTIIKNNNNGQNRLVTLYNSKINTYPNSNNLTSDLDKLGISSNENTLFDYVGGPGSSYGDGNTFIGRAVDTNSSLSTPDAGTIDYLNSLGLTDYIKVNQIGGLIDGLYKSKKGRFSSMGTNISPTLNLNSTIDTSKGFGKTTDVFSTKNNNSLFPPMTPQKIDFSGGKENIDFYEAFGDKIPKNSYQQSSPDFIRPEKVPEGMPVPNQFGNTMGYSALLNSKLGQLQDFRSKAINPTTLPSGYEKDSVNIATRIGIGNPGARPKELKDYINRPYGPGQDKVNLMPLWTNTKNPWGEEINSGRDMIKFGFEVINNDNPSQTTKAIFRAFLTNFSDNHSADWNGQRYMGRGENFYTYQGFNREVSFQFKVFAQSKQEMMPLYQKLNYLVSSLYPDYSGQGFMRGNLVKLTIGEYFYRTPGVLKSLNITVDDNYPWEIKYNEPETSKPNNSTPKTFGISDFPKPNDSPGVSQGKPDFQASNSEADQMELPQILNVSCTFTPILENLPSLATPTIYDPKKGTSTKGILISDKVGGDKNFIKRTIPLITNPIKVGPTT